MSYQPNKKELEELGFVPEVSNITDYIKDLPRGFAILYKDGAFSFWRVQLTIRNRQHLIDIIQGFDPDYMKGEGVEDCGDMLHKIRIDQNGDNWCPICGTDLRYPTKTGR